MSVEASFDVAHRSAPGSGQLRSIRWLSSGTSNAARSQDAAPDGDQYALVLSDVVAGYGSTAVLRGLNLRIAAGEVVALMGRNGAGKSTTAQVACGLMRPRSGTVHVSGRDPSARRGGMQDIGHCPQDCALFPALTIQENLSTFAALHIRDRLARPAKVDRLLRELALVERADQIVGSLSGGWRRRVNLAVALVGDARLLVLDEPTEAVDEETRGLIAEVVRRMASAGTGCLLVSHDDRFVERVSDRIAIIANGRLALEGYGRDLVQQAFGSSQFLEVRFDAPVGHEDAGRLRDAALAPAKDGACWRFVGCDPVARAHLLEDLIERNGGSMTVRRPGLADLLDQVEGVRG